jgi:hypothetical protein
MAGVISKVSALISKVSASIIATAALIFRVADLISKPAAVITRPAGVISKLAAVIYKVAASISGPAGVIFAVDAVISPVVGVQNEDEQSNAEWGARSAERKGGAPHPSCGHLLPRAEKESFVVRLPGAALAVFADPGLLYPAPMGLQLGFAEISAIRVNVFVYLVFFRG